MSLTVGSLGSRFWEAVQWTQTVGLIMDSLKTKDWYRTQQNQKYRLIITHDATLSVSKLEEIYQMNAFHDFSSGPVNTLSLNFKNTFITFLSFKSLNITI